MRKLSRVAQVTLDDMVSVAVTPFLDIGPVACWDLDSTVCSTLNRRHMVPLIRAGGPDAPTWDDYSMLCPGDDPVHGSVALMRELSGCGYTHIAVSGRSLRAHDLTRAWAAQHDVPLSAFFLRPDGDHTPNGVWKIRVLQAMQRFGLDIRMFFEDWDEVAAQIRNETGIPVVGINPFYPPEVAGSCP